MDGYPDNWDQLRKQTYKRDSYQCQNCGAKGGSGGVAELHAHHIVPLGAGGNNAVSNLVTLCRTCHGKIHDHFGSTDKRESGTSSTGSSQHDPEQIEQSLEHGEGMRGAYRLDNRDRTPNFKLRATREYIEQRASRQ